jgi:SAM-dependent methyltransferase
MAWGFWRIPERRLRLLGDVRGQRVLELGCGAARWSLGLSRKGASAIGIDTSGKQLSHALRVLGTERPKVPLLRASAERLPFRDAVFDLAFCDFGALTFADPERAIPEAARVLRPGGRLVFAQSSPIRFLFEVENADTISFRLQRDYFSLGWLHFPETNERALTYSGWVHLFRRSGFVVEDLLETIPGPKDRSTYLGRRGERWARHWPIECLWSLRKEASPDSTRRGRTLRSKGAAPNA